MTHIWLGIDTGGTFTDFVCYDGATLRVHKRLSTPAAPDRAITEGVAELALPPGKFEIIHGSTVATNAVLEHKGVRTAYITNRGLADILTIGRQARRELYNLQPALDVPPVPTELCWETGGRLGADGSIVENLTDADLQQLHKQLAQWQPAAVAINLLFSCLDDRFERIVADTLPKNLFVTRSSAILPELNEYERGIVTWLNSYVGPIVAGYLRDLQQSMPSTPISVMQSSGGTVAAKRAGQLAVHMLLSGPAGGLAGARFVAKQSNVERLLTFDMGGTSTDVALIDGANTLTTEGHIAGYPVAVPMVDIHTIGAGGGSIARVDAGGLLQVGPESAGAVPGPACYGRGGKAATVTDANVVLGRLPASSLLGDSLALNAAAARTAIAQLAAQMGTNVETAAAGVIRLANEHMVQALRVITVQRGIDPRRFTLVSFGGAGGLHVCELAEALAINHALVPVYAGVLSALGMLVAPRSRTLSATLRNRLTELSDVEIANKFVELVRTGSAELTDEGVATTDLTVQHSVDVRYRGQSFALTMPWHSLAQLSTDFPMAHEARYGHRLPLELEIVTLRVTVAGPTRNLHIAQDAPAELAQPIATCSLHSIADAVPLYARDSLAVDQVIHGPALITESIATTYVAPHWHCHRDHVGNLLLRRER